MYCPNCGQERVSTETSFCSRCGYLLTGTAELLQIGGSMPQLPAKDSWRSPSPRNRGLKQGLFIFLLSFLIVPLMAMLTLIMDIEPYPVAISAILLSVGGILRAAYALLFESPVSQGQWLPAMPETAALRQPDARPALPAQQSYPAASYVSPVAGGWRDTNDLQPTSVTENTTKLLDDDEIRRQ